MTKQIDIPDDLHADVKAEVALRNKSGRRFKMQDASTEAFRPWLDFSRSHRRTENQKTGEPATTVSKVLTASGKPRQ